MNSSNCSQVIPTQPTAGSGLRRSEERSPGREGREVTGHILGSAGGPARRKCFLTRCGGSAICKVRTAGVKRGPLSVCLCYMKSEDHARKARTSYAKSGPTARPIAKTAILGKRPSRLPVRDIQLDLMPLAPERQVRQSSSQSTGDIW